MKQLVTDHPDGPRWKGRKFVLSDFKEVREYIDACLNPASAPTDLSLELTSDFPLLLKLIEEVDASIPWPSREEIDQTLKVLPARPKKPFEPRRPEMLREFEDFQQMREDFLAKIEHQRTLHLNGLSGGFALRLIKNYESFISESYLWEEKYQNWLANYEDWVVENDLYDCQFPEFRERVVRHEKLIEAYRDSVPQKKIVVRLHGEIKRSIEMGASIERVSWKLLPQGEMLVEAFRTHLEGACRRLRRKEYDADRLEKIWGLKPSRIFVGQDEFDGYFVFVFDGCPLAVLECPWVGNALYLIKKDRWIDLSKLSKGALLEGKTRDVERMIHSASGEWFKRLCTKLSP